MLSPKEKTMSAHPKLTCDWVGPFRVIGASAFFRAKSDKGHLEYIVETAA
ncbi:unnamed protein product [Haemonchus placei]|uniref:DUF982 domain-containing protein n=1 Tax=Haemonchus placei TaxID=6290 RepID=A0A0N4WSK8_HAEPC|nr:unnamed protein product [Haemonchus placei]